MQCNKFGGAQFGFRFDGVRHMIIIHAFVERVRRWAMYRNTVRELSVLSDRDLSDLGINRSDIEYVARKHASAI